MFENLVIPGLFATTLFMLALFVIDQVRLSRMRKKLASQSGLIEILKNDVRALFSGSVGEDSRIYKLEQRLRRMKERQEQLENSKHAERPYEQAIRMVQKGSSIEDLMSVCNLSKGEADLIVMMHRDKDQSNDTQEQYH
ncbi:MAG: DUF2802 domain-containing protein [Gammaproteobacteria bacterium]|nr:DUF2802 domain-containing protein [Gammaproteobacteria bacterium]